MKKEIINKPTLFLSPVAFSFYILIGLADGRAFVSRNAPTPTALSQPMGTTTTLLTPLFTVTETHTVPRAPRSTKTYHPLQKRVSSGVYWGVIIGSVALVCISCIVVFLKCTY